METVTVSPKFQVVIPRAIRQALGIQPGQKLVALEYDGRIEFFPAGRMKDMRGFLAGIDTRVPRERDRL
jgi:AbrB family looped-hinge helix DNA binding protein